MKSFLNIRSIFFAFAAVLVLFQFTVFAHDNRKQPSKLGQEKWILTNINGEKVKTDRAFIQFDAANDRFGGKGGCNGMGGNMKVKGSKIDLSQIISTKMFCEDTSALENKFFAALEKVDRYKIKGRKLFLYHGSRLVLKFVSAN